MNHWKLGKWNQPSIIQELRLSSKRLPAIADSNWCEPILFKANEKTKTVPITFLKRKDSETSVIQPKNSTRTFLVSNNQIARLDEDYLKTETTVEETASQSEQQLQNSDVGPSHQDEASAAQSSAEHQQPEPSEPSRTSARNGKQTDRFGEPISTSLLKKGGWM